MQLYSTLCTSIAPTDDGETVFHGIDARTIFINCNVILLKMRNYYQKVVKFLYRKNGKLGSVHT